MSLLTNENQTALWRDVIKHAEQKCAVTLKSDLEAYLVTLMIRYTNQPEVARQVLATALLEALDKRKSERGLLLQQVGDQCLLFAGLFPQITAKKHVKINYFVDMGRLAYGAISHGASDLFGSLAFQFVLLMDVLQSIRPENTLMPIEAYEQWESLGSRRAFNALQQYSRGVPYKR